MTNQVNQEFEQWFGETYKDLQFNKAGMIDAWQAATQASESEINSLKQRVEELQADNLRLREASQALVDRWHTPKWKDAEHTATFIHALEKALSSTNTQSLAEHDNEVTAPYKKALEFAEYMAKSTEQFMIAINHLDEADREEDEETVEILQEKRGEHWRAVNCSIYEFRQRSDRALKATP